MTREEWLEKLADSLRSDFLEAGAELPKFRVTCGWPSQGAKAQKKQRIGECWPADASADQHFEVFISPTLSDPVEVGGVLVHELVHAAVGTDAGHKAPFRRVAIKVGLEGKMTETTVGDGLRERLEQLTAPLGPYPHGKITFKKKKTQGTRMLKVQCPACGYTVRTTKKWLELGTPTCMCGTQMEAEKRSQD